MKSRMPSRSQNEEGKFLQIDELLTRMAGFPTVDSRATRFENCAEGKPPFILRISTTGNMKNGKSFIEKNRRPGPAIAWEKSMALVENSTEAHNRILDCIPACFWFVTFCRMGDGEGDRVTSPANFPVWRVDNSGFVCFVDSVGCLIRNMARSPQ